MVDVNDYYFPKIKAGILKRDGKIYPSKIIEDTQIYRVNFDKKTGIVDGLSSSMRDFDFKEVYFKPVKPNTHNHYRNDKQGNPILYKLKYAKLSSVSNNQDTSHTHKGYLVSSGRFAKKKHLHWVINEAEANEIVLDKNLIKSYKDDVTRDKGVDLIEKLQDHSEGVPCFYVTDDNGNITSFGHTGMFRLAYTKTIGDHIPPILKDNNTIDIPEAIFGNEKTFAGRVFFEDAFCLSSKEEALMGESVPQILSTPKPTTFQHYLEQTNENLETPPKKLAHYNSNNSIRGHKLYWHKDGTGWQQENQQEIAQHQSQYTKINPVKPNIKFIGRIRFENLSKVELGALLFALDLPADCCHKLGMGKPLGLGSIRINPKLHISNREERYTSLIAEWTELIAETGDRELYKKAFEVYVLNNAKESGHSLWATMRLNELKRMLNFAEKPANEKTRYMQIKKNTGSGKDNDFKSRNVLPRPSEV